MRASLGQRRWVISNQHALADRTKSGSCQLISANAKLIRIMQVEAAYCALIIRHHSKTALAVYVLKSIKFGFRLIILVSALLHHIITMEYVQFAYNIQFLQPMMHLVSVNLKDSNGKLITPVHVSPLIIIVVEFAKSVQMVQIRI